MSVQLSLIGRFGHCSLFLYTSFFPSLPDSPPFHPPPPPFIPQNSTPRSSQSGLTFVFFFLLRLPTRSSEDSAYEERHRGGWEEHFH